MEHEVSARGDARAQRRVERSAAAVRAATATARSFGLRVDVPVVLADQFSVQVHLAPAPVVAGVSTWTAEVRPGITGWWRVSRPAADDPMLSCALRSVTRELPPGPHERDGFAITFTTYAPPDPERTVGPADCAAMLPELHAALRDFPGELPLLGPAAHDIPFGLAALERHPDALSPAQRDRLLAAHERLAPFLAAPSQMRPRCCTATCIPGNLLATGGGLRWIDFEDVCRGPVGWDLALLRWMDPDGGATADGDRPGAARARCSDLRARAPGAVPGVVPATRSATSPAWDGYIHDFVAQISSP